MTPSASMLERVVRIGAKQIGDGNPCFIIGEAGSNHNGSLEQARRLVDVAARAGVDAVKFQIFRADRLYPRSAGISGYLRLSKSVFDVIAEMEMPYDWLAPLADYCRERGAIFLASAFDEDSVDRLDPFVDAYKVASYEMTHIPLIRHIAAKGKPVIISTGTAHLDEVTETVEAFRATGNRSLILMQCTAAYPAPLDALNVRAIATMKEAFRVPVGLSDHSREPLVGPLAAVSIGGNLLEKHFTLSNELPGPDHRFAVEPAELTGLVAGVRAVERALGNGEKRVQRVEDELRAFARRSIFALRAIEPGEPFGPENIAVLRCGNLPMGLPPKMYPTLLGRKALRRIPAEGVLTDADLA